MPDTVTNRRSVIQNNILPVIAKYIQHSMFSS